MEWYLKNEPKMHSLKKLTSDMGGAWYEINCIEDFSDHYLEALSSASSPSSWDGALSCAVLVKKEFTDDEEDNDSFESEEHCDESDALRLRLLSRNSTTLTPPSSPESGPGHSNESSSASDLDICGLRISCEQTNTIVNVEVKVHASRMTRYNLSTVPKTPSSPTSSSASSTPTKHHTSLDYSPDSKRRIHKCQFLGCKKVYTKSSHLKLLKGRLLIQVSVV
ncbi:hypothetical protein NQ317_016452 [Molorchus minor]|uniref:Uncharacterized protein n=1 Tax=Molorchus minor TaxID=1323400 RepID=A0ABQ9K166_9CUCU|nr:hypothetical protein NQ317_016452 [Molorchus minor]